MSRNRQRTKVRQQDNTPHQPPQPQIPPQQDANPFGLSFVVPTEFVKLPSKGRFYHEDSPLNGVTELEVKAVTAAEEDQEGSGTPVEEPSTRNAEQAWTLYSPAHSNPMHLNALQCAPIK